MTIVSVAVALQLDVDLDVTKFRKSATRGKRWQIKIRIETRVLQKLLATMEGVLLLFPSLL